MKKNKMYSSKNYSFENGRLIIRNVREADDRPAAPEFTQARRTSEIEATPAGVTEYTAAAEATSHGEKIPCFIAYSDMGRGVLEPQAIFTNCRTNAAGDKIPAEVILVNDSYLRFLIPCEPIPAT